MLKSELLDEADTAFHENDRLRCMEAISRLYSVFDDEYEALLGNSLPPRPQAPLSASRSQFVVHHPRLDGSHNFRSPRAGRFQVRPAPPT